LWAQHISAAKPQTNKVYISWPATNIAAPDDPDARRTRPTSHSDLADEEVAALKSAHAKFQEILDDFNASEAADTLYTGRGVVTVAGGEYFGPAIVGIQMLRQTGSALPVEVFLADWDEYEPEVCEKVLTELNARCVVLEDFLTLQDDDQDKEEEINFDVTHYQLKALALLFSSFEHILYLDSDSMPLINPERDLFSKEPYVSTGFVGWSDFWLGTEAHEFYTIAGMDGFPEDLPPASCETGQLLLDKSRHLKTLLLAAYYNVWGPEWYYPLLSQGAMGQGDKNTFESAAIVLGLPWYRVTTPVKAIGRRSGGRFRGSAMVQFHPADDYAKYHNQSANNAAKLRRRQVDQPLGSAPTDVRPAFIHANTPKMNGGHLVDEGDLKDEFSEESLRLWGSIEDQTQLFGEDMERRVWEIVVDVGCHLAHVIRDWKDRKNICKRLKAHWDDIFV
jgi:alpha 1,2-mannosyltransferase